MSSSAVALPASPADAPAVAAPLPAHAHKFGGSSLAEAGRIAAAAGILRGEAGPGLVVASAMRGVTDALIRLGERAATGDGGWVGELDALRARHRDAARGLAVPDALHAWLDAAFADLGRRLAAFDPARPPEPDVLADVHGFGELCASRLLHAALGGEADGWAWLDAREVLVVEQGELGAAVDWAASADRLAAWRAAHPESGIVATGFLARDRAGRTTTLGRNGGDYSGAILASLCDARELTIWTDVDGVLSADPRCVPDAVCLPALSYAEACELAYFGARVIHPQTLAPAMARGMTLRIRNSLRPERPGTHIGPGPSPAAGPVKGLSLVSELAVLELSGAGMIGVPGTAERLFSALHAVRVSVVMISQGSSEHSICCLVRAAQAEAAEAAVRAAFVDEIARGQIQGVSTTRDVAVLAAVGDGMVGTPGVAARLLGALAHARVNLRAIAQGASERNLSVAIAAGDAERALRAAHAAFWLSPHTVSIGVIGTGNVGTALLAQFADTLARLRSTANLDLRVRAIANSRRMRLSDAPLDAEALRAGVDFDPTPVDLDAFAAHVRSSALPHAVIVDCSASAEVAARYADWLAAGIHVVTPNKQAGSGDWTRYAAIREAALRSGARFRYEATVGAGLPVIQTLRSLLDTGDALLSIEGILSGTLAWLFNRYDGSRPFSALVREAHAQGFTEPDPRDDLGGIDVARKVVILAREAGWPLTLDRVEVEGLVPPALAALPREAFLARLEELDAPLAARLAAARAEGRVLRYLARLDRDGTARVGLAAVDPADACAQGRLTDNLVQFRTRRYAENPLVVQGPGAGPDVTAAGVFGDLLQIAHALGARI
ncbi:bifunctional aspartate kinase/homoserine dehydrogenase I [Coralloluteibacterium thermophilus]|uniref:Bifunctional aspartokinase/homoserine dehydrogenase n=1 Tax=Coralloluteibacterium thermophilum TaxID=2707049 RepID=A0ABV9NKC7_9GAMM